MITDGSHPSHMDPDPAQTPSSTALQSTTQQPWLPAHGVVLADAGAHLAWLGYYVELDEGQNYRKTGTFGPMAGHVNGAIGVKLAQPDRTVVVGCGDGCYSMSGFELMTAVEHNIPVIWVIFNDNEYKLIKIYQFATYGETGLVKFQNPDFAGRSPITALRLTASSTGSWKWWSSVFAMADRPWC